MTACGDELWEPLGGLAARLVIAMRGYAEIIEPSGRVDERPDWTKTQRISYGALRHVRLA